MTPIDPDLPAQLQWAADQIDTIISGTFWTNPFGTNRLLGQSDAIEWYRTDLGMSTLWVGKAATAHTKELEAATAQIDLAYRRLVALSDELRRQAQTVAMEIEAQQVIERLTNLLRQL